MAVESKTRVVGVAKVGIPVTDQDRALDFYVGTLGFDRLCDVPMPQIGGRWIEVAPAGSETGGTTLALVPAHDGAPAGVETGIRLRAEDATALHADLRSAGVDVDDLLLWEGVPPMFVLRDPDGNRLEVIE